jgi:hypothetical protein
MSADSLDCAPRHFIEEQDYEQDANHEKDERPPSQLGLAMQQQSVRREFKDPQHRRVRFLCASALRSPVTSYGQAAKSMRLSHLALSDGKSESPSHT